MRHIHHSILLLICLTIFCVQAVHSCSCVKMTFEQRFAQTGYIFVGKVIEIREDTVIKRKSYERRKYVVKLQVIENFKGAKGNQINLVQYETSGGSSCPNWTMQEGETYLIYGGRNGKEIFYDVACSPTQRFDTNSSIYTKLIKYRAKKQKKIYKRQL